MYSLDAIAIIIKLSTVIVEGLKGQHEVGTIRNGQQGDLGDFHPVDLCDSYHFLYQLPASYFSWRLLRSRERPTRS